MSGAPIIQFVELKLATQPRGRKKPPISQRNSTNFDMMLLHLLIILTHLPCHPVPQNAEKCQNPTFSVTLTFSSCGTSPPRPSKLEAIAAGLGPLGPLGPLPPAGTRASLGTSPTATGPACQGSDLASSVGGDDAASLEVDCHT